MSENNQMMSVEGQLVGMPLAGPESFSQQQLDYLKRALGVDETVLWESDSDTGTVLAVNQYITLSESLKSFDRVRIYYVMQGNWGARLTHEVYSVTGDRRIVMEQLWYREQSGYNNYWQSLVFSRYTDADLRITLIDAVQRPLLQTSWAASGLTLTLYKVVGIHRIAGGNQ